VSRKEFVEIGKRHNVPTFNDAAADVPPVENLFNYIEMGFDLVTFSGGKAIRGPQSAGLLFGRKDLIEAAKLNHSPNSDTIGRGMKVNKEEMLGMMVALERYLERDHDKEWKEWEQRVKRIAARAEKVPSVETERNVPEVAKNVPHLAIRWDEKRVGLTPSEVVEILRNGHPSIEASAGEDALNISVFMMEPEEVGIVGRRVQEVLEEKAG
jgi:L-seryl-tRNA(Ser) seleniumtransferase